jgi:hypothetical protein
MLTIIFGAGASFDSSPDYKANELAKDRLPLANELFSPRFAQIAKDFPIALALINRLRRSSNIEHELELISTEKGSNIPEQLLKIRRYINHVIYESQYNWEKITQKNTVYYEFIDTLQKWQENINVPINLITFNYDTLLDTACSTLLKLRFDDLDSYVSNNTSYKLFKPHGSINWFHLAKMPDNIPVAYGDVDHLMKELIWTPIFWHSNTTDDFKPGIYKFPAIAVPTETKTMLECPNNHKSELKKAIKETTCLLSIGWKAEEKHFLELWGTPGNEMQLKKIEIVNSKPSNVNSIIQNITRYGHIISSNITTNSEGFSNYVPNGLSAFLGSISLPLQVSNISPSHPPRSSQAVQA